MTQVQTKKDPARPLIVGLRKQHLSIYDIHDALTQQGHSLSLTAIHEVLRAEGFGRLPRRRDEDRPQRPRPDRAAVADVRQFRVTPRRVPTALGGLFVFLPWLVQLDLDGLVAAASLPGTKMIPAAQAVRAALALKLTSTERKSHVMDLVFDEGLALWTGLNVAPKTTFLSQYSSRLGPRRLAGLLARWVRAMRAQQLLPGQSFNLDFHSIPFFGADEFIEKHYVSRRSRRQKSVLAFLAQDADTRVLCYCNADLRKGEEAAEVLAFVRFWTRQTGQPPPHLVFDSQLTTYATLAKLHALGVTFITLRRRSPALLREMALLPRSAWRTVHLDVPHRLYQTPKVIDQRVRLRQYPDPLSARTSGASAGRPGPCCRLFQVQKSLKPVRWHRMTVSGWTMATASAQPCHRRDSRTQNTRSEGRRRGRAAARWRTASWCRSARFSSTRARWVLTPRKRPVRMRVIMAAIIHQAGRKFNVHETTE